MTCLQIAVQLFRGEIFCALSEGASVSYGNTAVGLSPFSQMRIACTLTSYHLDTMPKCQVSSFLKKSD